MQEQEKQGVRISDEDIIKWLGMEVYQRNVIEKQLREELAKKDAIIEQLQRKDKGK